MTEVGAFEAKNKLGSLLDLVEAGEEILITRHGRPVARLIPNRPSADTAPAEAAAARIAERAASLPPAHSQFDWNEWKSMRDEGRR